MKSCLALVLVFVKTFAGKGFQMKLLVSLQEEMVCAQVLALAVNRASRGGMNLGFFFSVLH